MGFEIRIGEWDESLDPNGAPVAVVEQEAAPSFDGDVGAWRTNLRSPSYSVWETFCRKSGLRELLLDRRVGLMRDHPGTEEISRAHVVAVARALRAYKAAHAGAVPGFCGGQDETLARLEWLAWWMTWAVDHCARPALHNR